MELKMKVIVNNAIAQQKQERDAGGAVKTSVENLSRIQCRDDKQNVIQFTVDYATGKAYELGKEVTVTVD